MEGVPKGLSPMAIIWQTHLNVESCEAGEHALEVPRFPCRDDHRACSKPELHRNPATCARAPWFNSERLHSELGDGTPNEIEARYRQQPQPTAA